MLLRNLKAPQLCNGTRLIANALKYSLNVFEDIVFTGYAKGGTALSPRIPIIPFDLTYLPSIYLQIPLKMTCHDHQQVSKPNSSWRFLHAKIKVLSRAVIAGSVIQQIFCRTHTVQKCI